MLIDTHCHLNMMIKKTFDTLIGPAEKNLADTIIQHAAQAGVTRIINVGTSVPESLNCITLARHYPGIWAAIGLHPTDCTAQWLEDFKEIKALIKKENKIVAIGECGIDKYHPGYDINRQKAAFKAQIELALEHNLALIVHSRNAYDETLYALDEFAGQIKRGVMHCFSEDQAFADHVIAQNFLLGIGGPLTYPKNNDLRTIFTTLPLEKIVLETDAPFLPPQSIRGQQNSPAQIKTIAEFLADLRGDSFATIAQKTTQNAIRLFQLPDSSS
ncbi:MAG: TatD family hydrolase [Candidatus Babeliales bacterium]